MENQKEVKTEITLYDLLKAVDSGTKIENALIGINTIKLEYRHGGAKMDAWGIASLCINEALAASGKGTVIIQLNEACLKRDDLSFKLSPILKLLDYIPRLRNRLSKFDVGLWGDAEELTGYVKYERGMSGVAYYPTSEIFYLVEHFDEWEPKFNGGKWELVRCDAEQYEEPGIGQKTIWSRIKEFF